jgi:hypothetical protein
MASMKDKYFIFMDESGNNTQDRFFVLGILMVRADEVAELFNFLETISSKIKQRSRENMNKRIDDEYKAGNVAKILDSAKSPHVFEMKFKTINKENEDLYIHVLRKYFSLPNVRFCTLVFDKKDGNIRFKPDAMSHWQRYLNNAAMLIENNIKSFQNTEFVILADQITQPTNEEDYENALAHKIRERLAKKDGDPQNVWGVLRLESDASQFLQLVDIFTGAVRHDFTKSEKKRKEAFMNEFRHQLGISSKIQDDLTVRSPNYFSVWRYKKRKGGHGDEPHPLSGN